MSCLNLNQLFDLRDKSALITGAAVGIGAAIAARFAEAGAKVTLADIDRGRADQAAQRLVANGGIARCCTLDVCRAADGERAVQETTRVFGSIDILVNNAGVFPLAPALDLTESLWDRVLDTNLKGAFFLAQATARRILEQGRGGSIINIASIDAFHPNGTHAHYDASKGALVRLTKSLALEWAPHDIRVNAIAPGAIETPGEDAVISKMGTDDRKSFIARIPLRRLGVPDDIARAALFLASAASDYMTGSVMVVDGGLLLA